MASSKSTQETVGPKDTAYEFADCCVGNPTGQESEIAFVPLPGRNISDGAYGDDPMDLMKPIGKGGIANLTTKPEGKMCTTAERSLCDDDVNKKVVKHHFGAIDANITLLQAQGPPEILADWGCPMDQCMDLMKYDGIDGIEAESPKPTGAKVTKTKKTASDRLVSDDDDSSRHSCTIAQPPHLLSEARLSTMRTTEDFANTIDEALREGRIDEFKATRLRECLESGDCDWSEVAFNLLCEQIPLKRNGKGYYCKICSIPLKGHTCPYCPICSTPKTKFEKGDDHVCVNCPECFEAGKRRKKLIQIKRAGHVCPLAAPPGTVPRKKARGKKGPRKNCTEL